jgi:hypothetical protein
MIFLVNYLTFGLLLAIILDGFSEYLLEYQKDSNQVLEDSDDDFMASTAADDNQTKQPPPERRKESRVLSFNQIVA